MTLVDGNVGMNINLTQLYEQIQSGVPCNAVLDQAVNLTTDQLNVGLPGINPFRITDYEQTKQMLCVEAAKPDPDQIMRMKTTPDTNCRRTTARKNPPMTKTNRVIPARRILRRMKQNRTRITNWCKVSQKYRAAIHKFMLKFTRSLCYTIRVKVGEFMGLGETDLNQLLVQTKGILKTSEAMKAGISKSAFYDFVRKNQLEKIAQGIYAAPDVWVDEMYLLQNRFPKAVFSHETSLFLHDMSEMEPMPLTVTVPANYNTVALLERAKVYYVKNAWYSVGICEIPSPDGFPLKVYDKERTVCDIIRKQNDMDSAAFNYALRQYVRSRDKDYMKLMKYAKVFRMESRIRTVMEVLL